MRGATDDAARWIYHGLWAVLVGWFKVPHEPPTLPVGPGEAIDRFQPAEGFLRYLKFYFWALLWVPDLAILVAMVGIFAVVPWLGVLLLVPALALAILPDIVAYIALHLRYDTTWYVMTDRSLRIRRGVWVIREITVTFENVQNIRVQQGPVQRWFGIADLEVETAGGGGAAQQPGASSGHVARIEGIANAPELRERILRHVRQSATTGLGDEHHGAAAPAAIGGAGFTAEQLELLRGVRDEVLRLASRQA